MGAAWKPVRGTYEGLRGGANVINKGEKTHYNPAQLLARRLKQNSQTLVTGNKYNFKTGEKIDDAIRKNGEITGYSQSWLGKHVGNRLGAAAHMVGDLTLGSTASMLGWAARPIAKAGVAVAGATATPIAKGVGHLTYQSGALGTELAVNGAKTVTAMSRNPAGRQALFWGTGGVMTAGAVGSTMLKEETANKLSFYAGNQVDALPGTLASQGANQGSRVGVDSLNADGDLVFAMHNLR